MAYRHIARLSRTLPVALVTAAAVLLAACGAASDNATVSQTQPAARATAAVAADVPAATPTAAFDAGASPAATRTTVERRADGLAGAPVPELVVRSVEYDAGRANVGAGRFPPLNNPPVVSVAEATWMRDDDLVLGAVRNGEARAYPLSMMTFHHVANDVLAGEPYLVTF